MADTLSELKMLLRGYSGQLVNLLNGSPLSLTQDARREAEDGMRIVTRLLELSQEWVRKTGARQHDQSAGDSVERG